MASQRQDEYDIVCVGFGKKSLALATALADQRIPANILILEREDRFNEDLSYASPDKVGGSPFLRDMITQQNPRSPYTFISFLHEAKLLAGFTNASQMSTFRGLTGRYMAWLAHQIEAFDWIAYGKEVTKVQPIQHTSRGQVVMWSIEFRDTKTTAVSTVRTKRVVMATGSFQEQPQVLSRPELRPFVLPLHRTTELMTRIYQRQQPANIAIVGADQEAAELFELLQTMPGEHRATMFIKGSALRVDDYTPFTQALVDGADPQFVQLPPEIRKKLVSTKVSLEHPTIDLATLERLYVSHYVEKVKELDHQEHRFRILPQQEIIRTQVKQDKVSFLTKNTSTGQESLAFGAFDIVMAVPESGQLHARSLLRPAAHLYDAGDLSVGSDYAVNFRHGKVAPSCGVWVLGSLIDRNQRRDDFNMLATSAHRALHSITQSMKVVEEEASSKEMAVL